MIKIKACKLITSKINYCNTAILYNAGRKAEILDEFGVWASGIIKKDQ